MKEVGLMQNGRGRMSMVSIVVPVYNVRDYLEKCVKSVLAQTYEKWEMILVDDGSTDGCREMCDALSAQDMRIRVIHKENGGLSDARNTGAKQAEGKYLLFLDSDDTIAPDMLAETVSAAETYQSDIVLFDYKRVEESGGEEICTMSLQEDCVMNLRTHPEILLETPSAWIRLFGREFYVNSGLEFPKGYKYEDLGTTPKLALLAERIVYVKKPLYHYLIRQGSIMTGTACRQSYRHRKQMVQGVVDYFKEQDQAETFAKELEYLTLFHMYFIPAKEMLYFNREEKEYYIRKCREYTERKFPDFRKNPYIQKRMSKKEQLQFHLIDRKLFWAVNLLSLMRKHSDRRKNLRKQ